MDETAGKDKSQGLDKLNTSDIKKTAVLKSISNGVTVTQATEAAGVDRTTHYYWQKTDEAYRKAAKEAEKALADSVEDATVQNAKGFEYEEVHLKYEYETDSLGKAIEILVSKEVVKKKHPPNVAAQIFLDCNLKSDKYKNTQKIIHLGKDDKDLFAPFTSLANKEIDNRIDSISERLTEHEQNRKKPNGSEKAS